MHFQQQKAVLSIIIPCYNEENNLRECITRVMSIAHEHLKLECVIVDDCSSDSSLEIASQLKSEFSDITVLQHKSNQGKGAAIHTGITNVSGDFVAIQDADLEYDPQDLKRLLVPLLNNRADVVIGSRFLSSGTRRVIRFWHSIGNRFLTTLSNMLTDLNLSDMETCYKVFRRDVIQSLDLKEKKFGFEPEVVAKIANKHLRIYEIGISYYARTYEEGKKINAKDGWRALYCILRYNLYNVPWPVQLFFYMFIGGAAAIINLGFFLTFHSLNTPLILSTGISFVLAAAFNYILCILIMFHHKARWNSFIEVLIFLVVVALVGTVDYVSTSFFINLSIPAGISKLLANALGLILNFSGRKWLVFPETGNRK